MQTSDSESPSVIWLDTNVITGSPSMQHLIASLSYFDVNNVSIKFICNQCLPTEQHRMLRTIRIPAFKPLRSLFFSLACNTRYRRFVSKSAKQALLHTTGASSLIADLISVHFVPADWLWIAIRSAPTGWREWVKLPAVAVAASLEFVQRKLSPGAVRHVVSRCLAQSLVSKGVPEELIHVIPTPYDHLRFSVTHRIQNRLAARDEYRFDDQQIVFSFVSQGSYHRKGVVLAVEIVKKLRSLGHPVHLMLIGGRGRAWERMRKNLQTTYANSSDWLHITGYVPDLAYALSASDAFIMPSLYEGFAAVEVEAAAMGLPLLLTGHPGVEMILKEGVNGWKIDFDPDKAAAKIATIIDQLRPHDVADVGEAITLDEWQRSMLELYRTMWTRKTLSASV
jgi:glycosyltransferase involved in cell wall biosynthesis